VLGCALVVASGWVLSALGRLNRGGYAVALLVSAGMLAVACSGCARNWWRRRGQWRARRRRRWRRPLPLLFLLLASLAVGGGFLHPPNNYDALSYRLPRMLQWQVAGRWEWLRTFNPRQNNRAPGSEWLAMPLLVWTGTDRWLFLINAASYALLPGLVFSLLTRLGIRPRVAAHWMWLLPSGYGLALQAGGMANDLLAAPLALAAVDFALRARQTARPSALWLSLLAAGLMTGIKGTNLPLLLPWAAAVAPSWRLLVRRPAGSAGALALAAAVSYLPTALLNERHCGDWTGASLEAAAGTTRASAAAFAINALQLALQNGAPPLFPAAGWWNRRVADFLPSSLRSAMRESNFGDDALHLGELPVEDTAGLGLGVIALLAASVGWARLRRHSPGKSRTARGAVLGAGKNGAATGRAADATVLSGPGAVRRAAAGVLPGRWTLWLVWLPWVSLAVYMSQVVVTCAGRLVVPYYVLLAAAVLRSPGQEALVRRSAWRRWAQVVLGAAIIVVVLHPARPLWPARSTLRWLQAAWPQTRWGERAARVYAVYGQRHDALAPIRELLPPTARRVGLVGGLDLPEASLWRPFGARVVVHVLPGDTAEQVRRAGIEYLVVPPDAAERVQLPVEEWLRRMDAVVVGQATFAHLASRPPQTWRLARLRAIPGG